MNITSSELINTLSRVTHYLGTVTIQEEWNLPADTNLLRNTLKENIHKVFDTIDKAPHFSLSPTERSQGMRDTIEAIQALLTLLTLLDCDANFARSFSIHPETNRENREARQNTPNDQLVNLILEPLVEPNESDEPLANNEDSNPFRNPFR